MNNEDILTKLMRDGYCIVPNAFTKEEVAAIDGELNELYDAIPDGSALYERTNLDKGAYTYGKHLRFGSLNQIPVFRDIFATKNTSPVTVGYLGNCHQAMQIFSTHEYKMLAEGEEKPRNSFWHFDPYYALKQFIYLTDTTMENGAFRIIPNTKHLTAQIRNEKTFKDICGNGYKVEHLVEDLAKPINLEAKAGDMIIFDTDIFHVGSNLQKENVERKVIIVHNRPI